MTTERILADELRPGDAIVLLGTAWPVDRIDARLDGDGCFGVARSGEWWAYSLVSGDEVSVIRGGAR